MGSCLRNNEGKLTGLGSMPLLLLPLKLMATVLFTSTGAGLDTKHGCQVSCVSFDSSVMPSCISEVGSHIQLVRSSRLALLPSQPAYLWPEAAWRRQAR